MVMVSKNFDDSEFSCYCCGHILVLDGLVDGLQALRDFVDCRVCLTRNKDGKYQGGYRCSNMNKKSNGARKSYHLYGAAADVYSPDCDLLTLLEKAMGIDFFGGVGFYPDNNFIHVQFSPLKEDGFKRTWGRIKVKDDSERGYHDEYVTLERALEKYKKDREHEEDDYGTTTAGAKVKLV
jgi:hypothetical protein